MAATKKAPAKKAPAKKVPANKAAARTSTTRSAGTQAGREESDSEQDVRQDQRAAKGSSGRPTAAKRAPAEQGAGQEGRPGRPTRPGRRAATTPTKASESKTSPTKSSARFTSPASTPSGVQLPEPRGVSKDGIAYTKDFDVKFLKAQRDLLDEEKAKLMGQATRLENEANSLIEEAEMGDVQFDDEGGEGDTMVVERERDLALSAQARQTIADIDEALARLEKGTYGYSEASGRPIPRERLEAIPWATVLVEEKVGGIGRR